MSDQVKIVAAEDAPSNTEGGEALAPAQNNAEEPEATAESLIQNSPVAETVEAAETEDQPLVDGPVGEVLDDGIGGEAGVVAAGSPSGDNSAFVTESEPEAAQAEAEDMPLVSGPVDEVLDNGNAEAAAEAAVESSAVESDTMESATVESATVESAVESATMESSAEAEGHTEEGDTEEGDTEEGDTEEGDTEEGDTEEAESGKSNVRILSVGQQVSGNVKRIADFGAFVDIGVGRDGLIHISELSVRRVGKVTDVLAEGQEVTAWIKKLDRDRNRISLTLIDPNTKTIRDLNKDDLVQGTVTRILPYGAFVDIGIGRDALLHVREMGVGYVAKPEDVVKAGDTIEARIIELSRRRGRVDLSLKGLREEPEPTPPPQVAMPQPPQPAPANSRRQPEPEPEPEDEDESENLDVLSPMELAFKRAMEAEGMEMNVGRKKQNKRNRRERNRSLQDEIISRTLSSGRK